MWNKRKFVSGCLALLLVATPILLANAEETIAQSEAPAQLIDLFKVGYDIQPDYAKKRSPTTYIEVKMVVQKKILELFTRN